MPANKQRDRIAPLVGSSFFIDSRSTKLGALRIQKEWITRLQKDASQAGKRPLMTITFLSNAAQEDWLFMPKDIMVERTGPIKTTYSMLATARSVRFGLWDAKRAREKSPLGIIVLLFAVDGLLGIPLDIWSTLNGKVNRSDTKELCTENG